MSVGFAFERDVQVSTSVHRQAEEPFDEVPYVEAHNEHLQHLCRMDALMLDEFRRDGNALAAEQQTADVDGVVLAERNQSVVDNLHIYS